ncbi:LuxR family two component transcriptional regulator [Calothrix parasitica NIES-267]|uniref:LuxR family two component transcriptional regulator n=1 Tax=Calothrix parasitica NIES-267 TaxID=1973488 RepID=A0A1Z4LMA4_9CYAN|nr:LuxR family two component transcriptional regulator [Calothrix parasitica NIES-267]
MLDDNPKLTVIKSGTDIDSLTDEIIQLQPDVVLLDWNSSDFESISQSEQFISATIILLNELEDIDFGAILNAGVKGILPQTSTESEIIAAVEAVASGLVVLHPEVIDNLQLQKTTNLQQQAGINSIQTLTPREIEILQMLTPGLSNKAIAKQLNISDHTVKFHVSSIFQKLNVSTRTEAVAVGVRLGLIML